MITRPCASWRPRAARYAYDTLAVLALACLTLLMKWPLLTGGTMIGVDPATYFYPMYSYLGESLRSGDLPGWNPYHLSGAPFAADPQSGWMYLPAMLCFTLLPLAAAAKSFMFLTLLLTGLAAYALARVLGMSVAAALLAGIAYEFSGRMVERNVGCFACAGVAAWLPLVVLGTEMAVRSRTWPSRGLWWGLAGLALSQELAIWLGQGAYYALLLFGGYLAYRTLISPPEGVYSLRARVEALMLHGAGVAVFACGLAVAGLLPRLEYNRFSNLAGGYEGGREQAVSPGWTVDAWPTFLERTTSTSYIGGAVLALAVVGPLLAGRRMAAPFWTALSLASLVLSMSGPTPLHALVYVLPLFERLHPHAPGRVHTLLYLGIAMLAGAAWSALPARRRTPWLLAVAVQSGLLLLAREASVSPAVQLAILAAVVLVWAGALLPSWRAAVSGLLLSVVFLDLFIANTSMIAHRLADPGAQGFRKVDLQAYYAPNGAAAFLREKSRNGPSRYFGYHPSIPRQNILYRAPFADPGVTALQVNNRSTVLGLQDITGYNPIRLSRYDELIDAANGRPQEYREAYVYERGLNSPLLDLLNARYIVVPAVSSPGWSELRDLEESNPVVYREGNVRVLENTDALPRAWIVHAAQTVRSGEALSLLSTGTVDPATTALLEDPPPPLSWPSGIKGDRAEIELHEPDRIRIRAQTSAPGLLVLSEMHYPAWKAYLNDTPTHLYVADHVLSGIALPAGAHTVELRFESTTLRVGTGITLASYALLAALGIAAGTAWTRERYRGRGVAPIRYGPAGG